MASLQLRFLGAARLQRDGNPVALANAKALAVLGYLAARGQPVARDAIVDLLWPESSPEAARKNLRNALWAIGRDLGRGVVVAEADRLALAPGVWVDLRAFEEGAGGMVDGRPRPPAPMPADALSALAALYRGPFLDGIEVQDAPGFELWLAAERDRRAACQLRVLGALADARRRSGDWPGLADAARRALQVDRLHEPMHRDLVEALARSGQRAEALRAYEGLRQALDAELGVPPLPETKALAAAVEAGTLGLPTGHPEEGVPVPGDGGGPGATGTFVGRGAELQVLARAVASSAGLPGGQAEGAREQRGADGDERLEAAPAGRPGARVVMITGEPGIGKTRLWRQAAHALPNGAVLAEARALASTRALPFVPVVDLLSRPHPFGRLLAADSPLAPLWLSEIARLLPDVRLRRPELRPPIELPLEEERRRLFEALAQVLRAADGRPLVAFVDDVHWADDTTLSWLGFAVHRLRDEPFLLVVAYRQEEAPALLRALTAGWEREGIAERVALERLDDEAAGALLDALGAGRDVAARLRQLAGGNPLFLTELALIGGGDVPPRLAEAIRARLDRLDDASRQVLQAAAVLEPDADFGALRRTAGRSEDETLDALDALVAASILAEEGGQYAFAHPLVGAVVRDDLSAARRAVLHRRAAEALANTHSADLGVVAGRLGRHHATAGEREPAARYLAMAGERAFVQAATGEAVALYEEALSLDPAPERRLDVARARVRSGDAAGAREAFGQAYEDFEAAGNARLAAEASLGLAGTFLGMGHPDQIVHWAERGMAHLEGLDAPAAQALGRILLGAGGQDRGQSIEDAERHFLAAARLAREHDLPLLLAQSQFELGNLRARQGDLAAARAAFRDAIQLAQAAGESLLEAIAHNNAAYHALLDGDLSAAKVHRDAGLALAERADLAPARQWLFSTAGEIELAEARWDQAESWFRKALAEAERHDNLEQVANTRANLARVERGRGRLREAALLLDAAAHAAARLQSPFLETTIHLEQADVALARGGGSEGEQALEQAERLLADHAYPALQARAKALRQRVG